MARAKQTDRAEARRRYRQTLNQGEEELESGDEELEAAPEPEKAARSSARTQAQRPKEAAAAGRGFGAAFRAAYHPPNIREDLRALPTLLRHVAFLLPVALILGGTAIAYGFWNYTGGQFAWQVLVAPGTGFGLPQLVTGFLAPRASYVLGFLVSLVQGLAATFFVLQLSSRLGTPIGSDQVPALLTQAFLAGPVSGTLFASAAAWYRRFLRLSSPRRPEAGGRQQPSRSAQRAKSGRRSR